MLDSNGTTIRINDRERNKRKTLQENKKKRTEIEETTLSDIVSIKLYLFITSQEYPSIIVLLMITSQIIDPEQMDDERYAGNAEDAIWLCVAVQTSIFA